MNDIPLVKDNGINAINTSLIAAKKSLQLVYSALDNVNKTLKDINKEIDAIDAKFADYLLKDDVVNSITDDDMRPVTSNAVAQIAPVDTVASGNLHSVTSNGVANLFRANKYAPDINNAIEVGSYTINPDTLNIPSIANGVMFVFGFNPETSSTSTQWIYQLLLQTDGVVYIRQSVNPNSITPTNWSNWQKISLGYTKVRGIITSDSSGNLPLLSLLPTQEVEIIYVKGTDINNNRPIIPTRDASGYWWGQLFEWNSFTKVPNTTMSVEICYRVL